MGIKSNIIEFMEEKLYKPMLKEELAIQFGIKDTEIKEFYKILDEMEREGIIIQTKNGRYGLVSKLNLIVGRLEGNQKDLPSLYLMIKKGKIYLYQLKQLMVQCMEIR